MEGKEPTQEQRVEEASTSSSSKPLISRQISESQAKENVQKQLDELEVIQSIFDESILTIDTDNRCGRFVAYPVITEPPFYITFSKSDKNKPPEGELSDGGSESQKLEIKNLPHIEFTFALDDFYPSDDPPSFLMSCQWLSSSEMTRICEHLDGLYGECQSEILYSWFTFLRDDLLPFLGIAKELNVTRLLYNSSSAESIQNNSFVPSKCRGDGQYDQRIVPNDSMPNILRILSGE